MIKKNHVDTTDGLVYLRTAAWMLGEEDEGEEERIFTSSVVSLQNPHLKGQEGKSST